MVSSVVLLPCYFGLGAVLLRPVIKADDRFWRSPCLQQPGQALHLPYWLRVSGVAGLARVTDQEKAQGLPVRGDGFESEAGVLSFLRRAEPGRDLRRHNSAPNIWSTLTEVA